MKNTLSVIAATAVAFFALTAAAVAQECAAQGGIVVHPDQGVQFLQVSYSFAEVLANVGLKASPTGEVDVDVSQLESLMSSGFINVVTPAGWVTQNLPVLPGFYDQYGYQYISTTLNLNVALGQVVSNLNATVCYSSQVLSQISSTSFDTFTVGSTEYNAEGIGGNGMTEIPPPPPIGALGFDQYGLTRYVMQKNHQNVQTANNQCAPASVANNLAWLKTMYAIPINDQNIKGLRGNPGNSLVANLDMTMKSVKNQKCDLNNAGRWALNRGQGTGVPSISQLEGTLQYLNAKNIANLTHKHQGLSPFQCDSFNGGQNVIWGGLTSNGQGAKVDPNFIFNELQAGSAVEYDGVWYNRFGPSGGHAMDIIGAGTTNGRTWIAYVSDHLQTDRDPTDQFGTRYVDYSYLLPNNQTPNQQPLLVYGQMNGALAVAVMTHHP